MRNILLGFVFLSLIVMLWGAAELFAEARTLFWQEVPGTITKSEVVLVSETQSTSRNARPVDRRWYGWNLGYTYRVEGFEYSSARASLLDTPVWNRESADAMAAKYPVGAEVVTYVSPDDPALAILEPGFTAGSVAITMSSVLAACGALWLLHGINTKRRRC